MNVTCTGCPAKYAVPDEKVRGKKVRITCKHCGTNIVVDGTAVDATAEASPKPAAPIASQPAASAPDNSKTQPQPRVEAKPAPAAEVMFIVGFADDRQHPHTVSQIVEMYSAGKIDDEALVWKDGMADWLSPFDVPELAAAFRAKNVAPRAAAPAFAPVAEDEATLVVRSPLDDPEVAAAIAAAKLPVAPAAAAAAAPAPVAAAPTAAAASAAKPAEDPMFGKPAAARRTEKRADSVDLFGRVAEAGSEGDVSLDLGSIDERAQKLTGARNESSVLFSLDALTKGEPKAKKPSEKDREREASAALFGESSPDSLMNLGSAGLSALAAPDFTKPVTAAAIAQAVRQNEPQEDLNAAGTKGRGGVVLLVGFLGIAAAAAVAFVMMKKQPVGDTASVAASAAVQAHTSAEPSTAEAPAASNAPAAATASAAGAASAAPAASSETVAAGSSSAAAAKPTAAATPAAAAAAATPAATKPADPAAAAKPTEAAAAPATPATPATPEGAAFDKNAAVAALGAAAASAASCKTADGPTGSGKVSVTFAPSGRATATSVAGELAGTEVGGCVARLFRAAKVPPFSGDPVTVSKSFSVQ